MSHSSSTLKSRLSAALGMNRYPRLKSSIKKIFYRLDDPFLFGKNLMVGGRPLRVPSRFARPPWTHYEPNATAKVADWLESNPDANLIDVGCSIALYSLMVLSISEKGDVWAFDSDKVSLQSTRKLCSHVSGSRLHIIHGFVSATTSLSDISLKDAERNTLDMLKEQHVSNDPELCNYICLDGHEPQDVPVYKLDTLFRDSATTSNWLLKIDVEGAEYLVLQGAAELIRRIKPQILVSVHPPVLSSFGHNRDDIRLLLEQAGYHIAIDIASNEEHWWCTPGL